MRKILKREELLSVSMMIVEALISKGMGAKPAVDAAIDQSLRLVEFVNANTPID